LAFLVSGLNGITLDAQVYVMKTAQLRFVWVCGGVETVTDNISSCRASLGMLQGTCLVKVKTSFRELNGAELCWNHFRDACLENKKLKL